MKIYLQASRGKNTLIGNPVIRSIYKGKGAPITDHEGPEGE